MPIRVVLIGLLLLAVLRAGAAQGQAPADRQPATLRVLLPLEAASLTIEGVPIKKGGTTRVFRSPPLDPAGSYTYTISASWMPKDYITITRTRIVAVRAGATVEADLREADEKHPDDIFIRYVPTPMPVVEAMLKLAEVGDKDVVYDLGCGDGRIVVTAVSRFAAKRGVGVDLDPERIKDSRATAKAAGVENRVEFRQEDVLKLADMGEASVVMLFLSDEVNLRLRPVLQKSLKPGSRIVSHRFTMGDWKPLRSITVKDRDGTPYELHLWVVGEGGSAKRITPESR
jgi:uncharacterized protein (TIGR03000 family)